MKITFPHMGNLSIVAKALFEKLGQEVVVPPPCTKKTLELGIKYAPESICMPFKLNIGNYIEAAELGADTIVLTGGFGPCRFGYYGEVQREILRDLGYDYQIVVLELEDEGLRKLKKKINFLAHGNNYFDIYKAIRFAWYKAKALDVVEEKVEFMRPRELNLGNCDKLYKRARQRIDKAKTISEIKSVTNSCLQELGAIRINPMRNILRIAIVGEIYTILEPFANFNIESHLGRMGAETKRSLYLSQWANDHLFGKLLGSKSAAPYLASAPPYLEHFVGGHAMETVGSSVYFGEHGFDGIIQVAPLTCMPEIVAQSLIPHYTGPKHIPFMTLYLDEQSGEAGLITRLEAFCDLVGQRKKTRQKETC